MSQICLTMRKKLVCIGSHFNENINEEISSNLLHHSCSPLYAMPLFLVITLLGTVPTFETHFRESS